MVTVALRHPVNGRALREARLAAELSQALLARRTGLTIRTVSLAENGFASVRTLRLIADVLRVDPADLATDKAPPSGAPAPPPAREASP